MLADAQLDNLDLDTLGLVRHASYNRKGWNAREIGVEEIVSPGEVLCMEDGR